MIRLLDLIRLYLALPFVYMAELLDEEAAAAYEAGLYEDGKALAHRARKWERAADFVGGLNRGGDT